MNSFPIIEAPTPGVGASLIGVQWGLSCRLEDHLIEHAQRRFLARALEPLFRDVTAEGLQLLAARLLVFFHRWATTQPAIAKPLWRARTRIQLRHDPRCLANLLDDGVVLVLLDDSLELRVVVPRL